MKNLNIIFLLSIFVTSCGGGGAGGLFDDEDSYRAPSFSFDVPNSITASGNSSSAGCTGSSWDDCMKLTAIPSDPQNRITTKAWFVTNYNTDDYWCGPYTRTSDTVISSPVYCGHNGYQCGFTYEGYYNNEDDNSSYFTYTHLVFVNGAQCASGSAIDGYIQDANVFADLNNNFIHDKNEPKTSTNQLGQFEFNTPIENGVLIILKGGVDSETLIEFPEDYMLATLYEQDKSNIISPLSTITYFMGNNFNPHKDLNINNFNIFNEDPFLKYTDKESEAARVMNMNMQLTILINSISKLTKNNNYNHIWLSISEVLNNNKSSLKDIVDKKYIAKILSISDAGSILNDAQISEYSKTLYDFLSETYVDRGSMIHIDFFKQGNVIFDETLINDIETGKDL